VSLIEDNGALIRRCSRAFSDADPAAFIELFDEDACWHTPGRSPVAGDAVGRDAVYAHFERYASETDGTFRADLKRVLIDEDGKVVGIHHSIGEREGKELDVYCCVVLEVAEGRIVDGREHFDDLRAWDEFWS
jgi:ketosteroid isomerase-like protein